MITYRTLWPELPSVKVPVLHKVVYGYSDYSDTHQKLHEWSLKDHNIRKWCEANCRAAFYLHPGYTTEKFVHFEDDEDAVIFSLRWA